MKSFIIIVISVGMAALLLLYLDVPSTLITPNKAVDAKAQNELVGSLETIDKQLKILTEQFSKSQKALQDRIYTLEKTSQNLAKKEVGFNRSGNGEADTEQSDLESVSRDERLRRRVEAEYQQQVEKVSQLENEEIDYTWSLQAEDQIIQNIESDEKFDIREFDVICRSTHCSVRGEFGDPETREQKINWLMTLIPWNTSGFYCGDNIEGATGALYVLRSKAP